jgi:hypothetical protein
VHNQINKSPRNEINKDSSVSPEKRHIRHPHSTPRAEREHREFVGPKGPYREVAATDRLAVLLKDDKPATVEKCMTKTGLWSTMPPNDLRVGEGKKSLACWRGASDPQDGHKKYVTGEEKGLGPNITRSRQSPKSTSHPATDTLIDECMELVAGMLRDEGLMDVCKDSKSGPESVGADYASDTSTPTVSPRIGLVPGLKFEKEHQGRLQEELNLASRPSSESPIISPLFPPLPPGWEQFNHTTKQRSRMDPRLGQQAKELSGHKPMSRKSEEHRRPKEQRAEGHSLMSYRHKDAKRLFESDSE